MKISQLHPSLHTLALPSKNVVSIALNANLAIVKSANITFMAICPGNFYMNRSLGLFFLVTTALFSINASQVNISVKKAPLYDFVNPNQQNQPASKNLTTYHSDDTTGVQKIELRFAYDANYAQRIDRVIKDVIGYIKKFCSKTAGFPVWRNYLLQEHTTLTLLERAYIQRHIEALSIAQPIAQKARRLSKQHVPVYLNTRPRSISNPVQTCAQRKHELMQVQPVELAQIPNNNANSTSSSTADSQETDSKQ